MAKVLRGGRKQFKIRNSEFGTSNSSTKLLKSLAPTLSRAEFAITGGLARPRNMSRARRIGNTASYQAGRIAGAANRIARRGFKAIRTRIPGGIKTRLKGIGRRVVGAITRIRRPQAGGIRALPPAR